MPADASRAPQILVGVSVALVLLAGSVDALLCERVERARARAPVSAAVPVAAPASASAASIDMSDEPSSVEIRLVPIGCAPLELRTISVTELDPIEVELVPWDGDAAVDTDIE